MDRYRITINAEVASSLTRTDLEAKLVASLFDIETEEKISDGQSVQLEVVDYELTQAIPIGTKEL
jgi:hypothetical protein